MELQHREHLAYERHYDYLTNNGKTINRINYKGVTIRQQTNGFYIDKAYYFTLQHAHDAIDRRNAFEAFFDLYGEVCTWFTNVMFYPLYRTDSDRQRVLYALFLIEKHNLPLVISEIKDGFAVEFKRK